MFKKIAYVFDERFVQLVHKIERDISQRGMNIENTMVISFLCSYNVVDFLFMD